MLYLEAFYQSAESKYAATILLIEAVRELLLLGRCAAIPLDSSTDNSKSNNNASNSSSCSVEVILSYLTQLSSACYINTAVCLVQHTITSAKLVQSAHDPSPPSLPPSSAPSAEIAVPAPKSVIELVGDASFLDTPLAWCKQGLALCDTLPGRLRLLLVLEKMHRYIAALKYLHFYFCSPPSLYFYNSHFCFCCEKISGRATRMRKHACFHPKTERTARRK